MTKGSAIWLATLTCLAFASSAQAGGFDTPMLYSARHMGMAGTAVSYVDDPSALFHNPAGLANIRRGSALLNLSPAVGKIRSSPSSTARDIESETTLANFFLLGGAARVHDRVTLGLAVFPVASAGGEYRFESRSGDPIVDKTRLVFLEASPGIAFNLPGNLNLGAGYRVTMVSLERLSGNEEAPSHDFDVSGLNFAGFRFGAQWHLDGLAADDDRLSLGLNYRTKTTTDLTAKRGVALFTPFDDVAIDFTLPSRLSFGSRYDVGNLGVAFDVEYGFNSQNTRSTLRGDCGLATNDPQFESCQAAGEQGVNNVFRWRDAWTLRPGVEYRVLDSRLALRAGYVWDQRTSTPMFPTAFGTPPGNGHIGTVGAGWTQGPWRVNAAYAYRRVSGSVTEDDIRDGGELEPCPFCSAAGERDYALTLQGIYMDLSYDWL